ncbi:MULTISPECIES: hypothetical protein [Brevibacillus]|uniref:DUF6630 family protein n=1 Tax=Brevibacillus TaxID=55080 RepID=UPI000D0F37A6|nr:MULTISPECIES: hypothetical protein [Brevibacillus]MED1946764.1 hypothetical protein [Brevibacillus formosus]MED1997022.1 hypothetical protein [Brevibacillus formosus]MED2084939.1 hypothetical protein [Brevibacillus formosus]PSK20247.1 hypothetical protein C7R94_05155 [Brevibacillus sp. NRRL NRS-603]
MYGQGIAQLIFPDSKDLEEFISDHEELDLHESLLKYGLSTKKFLFLDYKGEQYQEIVNYILDYEFNLQNELASQEELEELGNFEYEYVPEKIREANRILSQRGYGLFTYPTSGDFYALFIARLENKTRLLEVELLADERIPLKERYIKYYS